uniref:Ca2+-triggered coelenterazine-binding protein 3 n=1 Tax=Renilla muelleri TaxID=37510 RepID=C9V490_RENMU|nr:Ca2+-triggered coelenterazine-binding protein 3 [Renilla muelleri]
MPEITESERAYHLRKMKTRMQRVDVTGDGFISREDYELIAVRIAKIAKLSAEKAEETRQEFLRVADQLGLAPGVRISVEGAAVNATDSLLKMKGEEKAMAVIQSLIMYDCIDTDKDGYVSLPEFKAFLQAVGPDITDDKAITCFNTLDFNKNGQISRDEFLVTVNFLFGLEETALANAFYGDLVDQ